MVGTNLTIKWSADIYGNYGCPLKKESFLICVSIISSQNQKMLERGNPKGERVTAASKAGNAGAGGLGTKKGKGHGPGCGQAGQGLPTDAGRQPGAPRGLQSRREGLHGASFTCQLKWASGINHLIYKLRKDETCFVLPLPTRKLLSTL